MLSKEQIENNWNYLKNLLLSTKREGIESLIEYLEGTDFKMSPASSQYHHSHYGGLVQHSIEMYKNALVLNKATKFDIKDDEMIISCILHDLCKANSYSEYMRNVQDESTGKWSKVACFKNDDKWPLGHAEKSVIIAQMFIKLNSMEVSLIMGHMGPFDGRERYYTALSEKYPEIILTHTADMLSSKNVVLKDE